jgi:hypothetical protein
VETVARNGNCLFQQLRPIVAFETNQNNVRCVLLWCCVASSKNREVTYSDEIFSPYKQSLSKTFPLESSSCYFINLRTRTKGQQ